MTAFYNVVESLDAHVMILDSELNVIKHTNNVLEKLFHISQHRNFSTVEIDSVLLPNLMNDIEGVLWHNKHIAYDIDYNGRHYYFSINRVDISIDQQKESKVGVVISFVDKTELTKKDRMLFHQSKMASMGEMIANIAHQWKQPLAALSNIVSDTYIKYQLNKISDENIEYFLNTSNLQIQKMSDTIDDFKNFFRPNKNKTKFHISVLLDETLALMQDAFENNAIGVEYRVENDFELETFKNELMQVLINLLANAKDAMRSNAITHGHINIITKCDDEYYIVMVQDNAGGIPLDVIDRVFEPYFTTKFQDEGTGLGLYMSKMIMENSIHGRLSIVNHDQGVLATLSIPKSSILYGCS